MCHCLAVGTADAEIKDHLLGIQSSTVLPLKPGVGQNIAMHASATARDFFLANFCPPVPVIFIFFQNLSRFCFFYVLVVADANSCAVPQNEIGHPALCQRRLMQVPVLSAGGI